MNNFDDFTQFGNDGNKILPVPVPVPHPTPTPSGLESTERVSRTEKMIQAVICVCFI